MNNQLDVIDTQKAKLSEKTVSEAKTIIKEINAYLSGFNISSSLSFSKPDIKKLENDYMNFLMKISENISTLTKINAEVASLTILADKATKVETTVLLQKNFDAFCNFEKALYEYTESIDTAFSNNKISISLIVSATQKLKLITECLMEINT